MKIIYSIIQKFSFRERPIIDLIIGSLIIDTWQTLKPCDVLLNRHDLNCQYFYKGKAYSPLFDSLGEIFQKKGYSIGSIVKPLSHLTGEKAHFSPVSYNQSFLTTEIVRVILYLIKGRAYSEVWVEKQHFKLWCKILEKCKPQIVVGSMPKKEMCQAGKEMGIRVYDLQHGVISEDVYWYGERFTVNEDSRDLPDGFLVWDESAVQTLEKWRNKKGIEVIKIGNPWFSRFLMSDLDDTMVQEALRSVKIRDPGKIGILLTLQWGMKTIYPNLDFNGYIVPALEEVIIRTKTRYNWVIRLHPFLLRSAERIVVSEYLKSKFDCSEVQKWVEWSEIPLPVILKEMDLHITDSSSVVIEAGWMGVKSCILNSGFNEGGVYSSCYQKEKEVGLAKVIPQEPDAIMRWIEESLKVKEKSNHNYIINNNLDMFIDSIGSG